MHIGTNNTSKYKSNEVGNKILDLKCFVACKVEMCKVIISTSTIRLITKSTRVLSVRYFVNYNIRNSLGNTNLHLKEYGASQLAFNNIAAIKGLSKKIGYQSCNTNLKPTKSMNKDYFRKLLQQ